MEYPLGPASGTWLSLLPDDADDETRTFFALLDAGILELWQREDGIVHAYDKDGNSIRISHPEVE